MTRGILFQIGQTNNCCLLAHHHLNKDQIVVNNEKTVNARCPSEFQSSTRSRMSECKTMAIWPMQMMGTYHHHRRRRRWWPHAFHNLEEYLDEDNELPKDDGDDEDESPMLDEDDVNR